MAAHHVTIGPEFFAKAKNDYSNWEWALVREFMQNSMDCGSRRIEVAILEEGGKTILIVANDGEPMTEDILVGKLLCLGGSGKHFEGTNVGGFGKAKEILYFCHEQYEVHSGNLRVSGSGASYDLDEVEFLNGTRSRIIMDGHHQADLVSAFSKFARYAQWPGTLTVNEDHLETSQRKGSRRRDLGFGVVFTNRSCSNLLVVRIGGIPMFTSFCGHDRCVIVELKGHSDEVLTANRDGLRHPYSQELSSFITELSVDTRSALKDSGPPRYTRFAGERLSHRTQREMNVRSIVMPAQSDTPGESVPDEDAGECEGVTIGSAPEGGAVEPVEGASGTMVRAATYTGEGDEPPNRRFVTLGEEFIIKNETGMEIPEYYRPDSLGFSKYSRKLIRIWGRLMLEMYRLFDVEGEFAVGFIFEDSSTAAEHENGRYGRVYYIKPARVVEQDSSYSRSFKKRWKLTDRDELVMAALHEFVHGLGFDWHDERYANKLTWMAAKVIKHRRQFNWCFK